MKWMILGLALSLVPMWLLARDLRTVAKKEHARRSAVLSKRGESRHFTNRDLDRFADSSEPATTTVPSRRARRDGRDLAKERAFWTKEKVRHERELARVDARIRRLEWRLKDRDARRKPGERLARDPAAEVLEANLESLREERKQVEQAFRGRARKAGAFPGWLR